MYRGMQRMRSFRTSGSIFRFLTLPQSRRKTSNSWSAIQDTYISTNDIFERHKVVFTVSTSIASVVTAWIGYSLRHYHESRVDRRLESIEKAMKHNYEIGDPEFKKLVSRNVSLPACLATAGTMYGLGWRGGRWYQSRKYRREQMKLLGQMKPRGSSPKLPLFQQLEFGRLLSRILKRPLVRVRLPGSSKTSEASRRNVTVARNPEQKNTSV